MAAAIPRIPFSAVLSITNRCNLNCPHCFASANEHLSSELSDEQWMDIIDDLHASGVLKYTFSGGEPFTRPSWKKLVEYVIDKPATLRFNTNATLITDEIARYLRDIGRVKGFIVSLDGPDAETHDAFRGPGTFDAALNGIRALRGVGYRPQGFCTITIFNIDKIEATLHLAQKLELSCLTLTPITASGRGKRNVDRLVPGKERMRKLIDQLNILRPELGKVMSGTCSNVAKKVAELREKGPSKDKPVMHVQRCGAAANGFTIRADGQLVPCEQFAAYPCGSVLERPLREVWRDSAQCRHIRESWKTTLDRLDDCKNCEWNRDCNGGCPASAYSATGHWPHRDVLGCIRDLI